MRITERCSEVHGELVNAQWSCACLDIESSARLAIEHLAPLKLCPTLYAAAERLGSYMGERGAGRKHVSTI